MLQGCPSPPPQVDVGMSHPHPTGTFGLIGCSKLVLSLLVDLKILQISLHWTEKEDKHLYG